ncbi:hypothetical protein BDF19DRAFT_455908 [Syncephalis fuscata]|nr:hypothetical protein BDF19DRAFT_455908 [Syncephalis fuscata]
MSLFTSCISLTRASVPQNGRLCTIAAQKAAFTFYRAIHYNRNIANTTIKSSQSVLKPFCFNLNTLQGRALLATSSTACHSNASTEYNSKSNNDVTPIHKDIKNNATLANVNTTGVTLDWQQGSTNVFSHMWLRDHCNCSACQYPGTKQRSLNTFEIPLDIQPKTVEICNNQLQLTWPDGHCTNYSLDWLHRHTPEAYKNETTPKLSLWDAQLARSLPTVSYNDVMHTEEGVKQWLQNIASNHYSNSERYGIGFVEGVPVNSKDTEKLVTRISHVRHTHFGGFWELTSISKPLDLHTDNTYLLNQPGILQVFHMLHQAERGGESTFLDGFHAANLLKQQDPDAYRILSTIRTNATTCASDHLIIQPIHSYPILNHLSVEGQPITTHNANSLSPFGINETHDYYRALRSWQSIIPSPPPGLVVCFDNWRVLHGRNTFVGKRQLCGSYHGVDDWRARLRALVENDHSSNNTK